MPNVAILRQVAIELVAAFPKLTLWKDVYIAPLIMDVPAKRGWEIQIVDGGSDYTSELEGGVRREQFQIVVGIVRAFSIDSTEYVRYLKDITRSVFVAKETIITTLEGSFLLDSGTSLITRPLRVISEARVRKGQTQACLIKEVTFLGGLNAMR